MSKLGAPQRTRLLTYAKCALRGLSVEASSESGKTCSAFNIKYGLLLFYFIIIVIPVYLLGGCVCWAVIGIKTLDTQ